LQQRWKRVDQRIRRPDRSCIPTLLQVVFCSRPVANRPIRQSQLVVNSAGVRIQRQGAIEAGDGPAIVAHRQRRAAASEPGRRGGRLDFHGVR
jgi:hypothetical protein